MSKRFGKQRVPNCECTTIFTCRPCLEAAAPAGAPQRPSKDEEQKAFVQMLVDKGGIPHV